MMPLKMPKEPPLRWWSWLKLPIALRLLRGLCFLLLYCVLLLKFMPPLEAGFSNWEAEGSIFTGLVLGLLMTARNRIAYERWWEGRIIWGQLVNDSRNLCLKLREFTLCEPAQLDRMRIVVSGFARALMLHLRGGTRLQEIPGFERDSADPTHVPMHLAGEALEIVAEAVRRGQLDPQIARLFDPHMAGLMDACGKCERIRNTPIPASFIGLLHLGLLVYFTLGTAFLMNQQGAWGIPIVLLIFVFLGGLELLDTEIEEPFGTGGDDLALENYCRTIAASVDEALGSAAREKTGPGTASLREAGVS